MESILKEDDICLISTKRIEFPLETRLDIFKFLSAYDLQQSCINVSRDWRSTIQRYAKELPMFPVIRNHQDIYMAEMDRRWRAYNRRTRCLKYFIAVSILIVGAFFVVLLYDMLQTFFKRRNEQTSSFHTHFQTAIVTAVRDSQNRENNMINIKNSIFE
ncbi:hypothetical protein Ddc_09383 [Ditylenchus destructor]|nr:hypothetical protein Ddc_09383 [Ditylenchus destructor]